MRKCNFLPFYLDARKWETVQKVYEHEQEEAAYISAFSRKRVVSSFATDLLLIFI